MGRRRHDFSTADIVQDLASGKMIKQISIERAVSPNTITARLKRWREEMGAKTTAEAMVLWAIKERDSGRI